MATADEYANWIVQNEDKKGTPEFNIVAKAYNEAKASEDAAEPVALFDLPGAGQPIPTRRQQAIAPLMGLGYGMGRVGLGLERIVGEGMEYVGLKQAGQSLQQDAQQGRTRIDQEFGPYSRTMGGFIGSLGGEVAATLPVGGALALPFKAGAAVAPVAVRPALNLTADVLGSAGFNVPKAATVAQKFAYPAARVAGGAPVGWVTAEAIEEGQGGTGAVLSGTLGAASPVIMGMFKPAARFARTKSETIAGAAAASDDAIGQVAKETGASINDLDPTFVQFIRDQAANAFRQGKQLNAAALVRSEEFKKLGMPYLQGQITRDPNAFAMERNLRATTAGRPIMNVLETQKARLHDVLGAPASGASDNFASGDLIIRTLGAQDDAARAAISAEYKLARESVGKDLELPLQGLSQDYARVSDEFGDLIPSGVRNQFDKFGVTGARQTKLYTMEEADKLLKVINQNKSDNPAINAALIQLRNSVKKSITDVDANGGPYAKAVRMAAARFRALDANPAAAAVYEGRAIPDDFVRRYIINGKTKDVRALALALRDNADAFGQAKSQIAEDIRRAAFGEDLAADAAVAPERLARKLRELGDDRMGSFFSPQEIANYRLAANVATYIEKHPNAAAVNTSNTLVAQLMTNPALSGVASLAGKIPGFQPVVAAGKAVFGPVKQGMDVSKAINTNVPAQKLPLTEPQRKLLSKVLGATSGAMSGQLAKDSQQVD